jgi:DNA-binding NtrC family response regulator
MASSKRLLLVDDESSIRITLAPILQERGFTVTTAATIPEAKDKIRNEKFDLLLCDLNIAEPGDGFVIIRAIRQVHPQCVVVILTGYPSGDGAEGAQEKIDDYVVKPADIDLLTASLNRKLAERRSWEQQAAIGSGVTPAL